MAPRSTSRRRFLLASSATVGGILAAAPAAFAGRCLPAPRKPADREKFSNVMPPFSVLSDADIASVITYLRKNFAPSAPAVTAAQVAAQR